MKLAIYSDLHCEFADFRPPQEVQTADVVVLAGDIDLGPMAQESARRMFPHQRVLMVAGNHEYFHAEHDEALEAMRDAARRLQVDLLDDAALDVDGQRFLGCTLWTDFALYERPGRPVRMGSADAMQLMYRRMMDYRRIRHQGRPLIPQDTLGWHQRSRTWLESELKRAADGGLRPVVVTHHLPSFRSVAPSFYSAVSNPGFASNLDLCFGTPRLWIHGHTHHSFDYIAEGTRVIANPRGYPMRAGGFENPDFVPDLLVSLR